MQALGDVPVSLLQQLAHQQNDRRCAISADIVLGGGRARNHDGGRVLDLHLSEEDVAVLGELDLKGGVNRVSWEGCHPQRNAPGRSRQPA